MAIIPTQNQYPDRAGYLGLDTDRNVLVGMSDGILQDMTNSTPEGWVNVKDFGAKGDGITDDSQAFQAALDTKHSIFIPEGTYLVSNLLWDGSNNIYGASTKTILKNTVSNTNLITRTERSYGYHWAVISNIFLEGNFENNGISANTARSRQLILYNVVFKNFNKAFEKPYGNILNRFYSCGFEDCNFHYWAKSTTDPIPIHAGTDYFLNCRFRFANLASIYIDNTVLSGQTTFQDCVIEGNPGFGIFIQNYGRVNESGLVLNSTWLEYNATSSEVIINDISYIPKNIYINNSDQIYIFNSHLDKIYLKNSTVYTDRIVIKPGRIDTTDFTLENSIMKNYNTYVYGNVGSIIIDSLYNFPYFHQIQGIFMPPRIKTIKGLPNELTTSHHFSGTTPITISGETTSYTSTQVNDGINSINCSEFTINNGNAAKINLTRPNIDKYYLVTGNFKVISGKVNFQLTDYLEHYKRGNISTQDYFNNKWLSFALFGKHGHDYVTRNLFISDLTGTSSTIRLSEVQQFEFNTQEELIDFINSNATSEL